MIENNVPDPWGVTVTENNIGEPLKAPSSTFTLTGLVLPKNAGYWEISKSFRVYVEGRPNRLNRAMTKLLLGWEWMDT